MDNNNEMSAGQDTSEWRSWTYGQANLNAIKSCLMTQCHSLDKLKLKRIEKFATSCEESAYAAASSKSDYTSRITQCIKSLPRILKTSSVQSNAFHTAQNLPGQAVGQSQSHQELMLQDSQKMMTSSGRQTSAILTSAPPNSVNLSQDSMPKLQMAPQSNVSGLHKHPLLGTQPGNAGVETNQHYSHKVPEPQKKQQQSKVSKPKRRKHKSKVPEQQNELSQNQLSRQQMASHIQLQSVPQQLNPLQRELQQRIPTFGSSLQQQNQLFQSQSVDPEASSYLTAQTSNVNGENWQEVYQKIKSMNDMYLLDLKDHLVKMTNFLIEYDSQPQRPRNERVGKLRRKKNWLEWVVKLLQMTNTDIQRTYKNWDKLLALEAKITEAIGAVRKRHIHQPQIVNVQHELPQTQNSQMASRDNQMNSQVQPTNLQIQLDGAHINASTAVSSKSNAMEHPHERLTKVVPGISNASLTTVVADTSSVLSMVDGMAGSAPGNGYRATVGEDLVATIKFCRKARTFLTPNANSGSKRVRHFTIAIPSDAISSLSVLHDKVNHLNGTDGFEVGSTAASRFKRPLNEPNHALIEEIAEINQRLIDTEVEIIDEDAVQTAVASAAEGIRVKCSYKAVALSPTLKYKLTSNKDVSYSAPNIAYSN